MIKITEFLSKPIPVQKTLIYLFVLLGPLGTLLTPCFFPNSTRTYYFFLLFFPLFFFKLSKKKIYLIVLFTPVLLYCLLSSFFSQQIIVSSENEFPLFRFCLLSFHLFFLIGCLNYLEKNSSDTLLESIIRTYLISYFISLTWGFFLYTGFYFNIVSLKFLSRFNILTQFGWGVLRFNPGSYANEYGVVSSFVCSVLLLKTYIRTKNPTNQRKIISIFHFILLFVSFIALILASTKTALITLFFSTVYMVYINKSLTKIFTYCISIISVLFLFFTMFHLRAINFFVNGFPSIFHMTDTHQSRISALLDGSKAFSEHPFIGTGFASMPFLHNTYLQFFFELGIFGSSLLLLTLLFLLSGKIQTFILPKKHFSSFSKQISMIALIHVMLFACTNHNLFHHLTWFSFLLIIICHYSEKDSGRKPIEKTSAFMPKNRL